MHSCPECGQACHCGGDWDDIDPHPEDDQPFCDHCAEPDDCDDDDDPEDAMPCGSCIVCDEPVDHSEAGFCKSCQQPFHWANCGNWHGSDHCCDNCKPQDTEDEQNDA